MRPRELESRLAPGLPQWSSWGSRRTLCRVPVVFLWLTLHLEAQGSPRHVLVTARQTHTPLPQGRSDWVSPSSFAQSGGGEVSEAGLGSGFKKLPVSCQRQGR